MDNSVHFLQLIVQASPVVQVVMAILLLLSLLSWTLIFHISTKLITTARFDQRFQSWLWSSDDFSQQFTTIKQETQRQGLEKIVFIGLDYLSNQTSHSLQKIKLCEKAMQSAIGQEQLQIEKGLATLANIGSVSPYIGLFGTVWGIMYAFIGLGQAQTVSLATVAPSIAEALIATALGLFAAIPATLAFNFFTAKANQVYEQRMLFCDQLITRLISNDNDCA